MPSIKIDSVSVEQLMAMGDGLLRDGQATLAQGVYGVALKRASAELATRIRLRLGLAKAPNARTAMMIEMVRQLEAGGVSNPFVGEGIATWLKTLPFEDDARFRDLTAAHAHLLPLANWQWNLSVALWAVRECRNVPGDYVELGVFKGHTTLFCADYVEFQTWPKRWWLYDTFDGIPEDQQSPGWREINKNLYQNKFSYEEVTERFARFPNIEVVKGRVPEVLREREHEQVAFLHVDLNNVPAEIGALEHLFDRISPGGLVLFDDYCWAAARPQFEAENAWFAARGLQVLGLPTGQGLFVKR